MGRDLDTLDIDHSLVLAIGMIAVQWARVEFMAQKIVVGLLDADAPRGLMLASNIGSRTISDFITNFAAEVSDEQLRQDLLIFNVEFKRLLGVRNMLVHNTWPETSGDAFTALIVRFKGKSKLYTEIWTPEQLANVIEEVVDLLHFSTEIALAHGLLKRFDAWEQDAPARTEVPPTRTALPPPRGPKLSERLNQLQSARG